MAINGESKPYLRIKRAVRDNDQEEAWREWGHFVFKVEDVFAGTSFSTR